MNDSVNYFEIIERIKIIEGLRFDKELAALLCLSEADFNNRKRRGSLLGLLVNLGIAKGWDLGLLSTGTGTVKAEVSGIAEAGKVFEARRDYEGSSNLGPCPVKCDEKLRKLCAKVKKIMEPNDGFSKALEANIFAFEESADLKKEIQNIRKTSSPGSGGGIPQAPARPTARRRKAG